MQMLAKRRLSSQAGTETRLAVSLAANIHEIREAQRLRYRVFSQEMGARVPGREQGIDCDMFDAYCDHLIVRDMATGEVVGTYRMLSGRQAQRLGRFYSDEEFDLSPISRLRELTVEVGRSCVHENYRTGATIAMLWAGLHEYVCSRPCQWLIGCASISLADGLPQAAAVCRHLARTNPSPADYRVVPWHALPMDDHIPNDDGVPAVPPLIKGYLRLGAYVCSSPAWDREFNSADVLILLPVSRLAERYARHFARSRRAHT